MTRVVVTGAASGIGRAVAQACHDRGDQLFLLDVDADALSRASIEVSAVGSATCDVTDAEEVERVAQAAASALGGIDLVMHAAGVSNSGRVLKLTPADERWVIDVNVLGTVFVAQSFARILAAQSTPSRLVLTGSEHSLGTPLLYGAVYTASKHAVLGYADVLRRELPEHVGVSVLCPGMVATDIWRSSEHRGQAYGGPTTASDAGVELLSHGMPAAEVATAVLRGVAAEEFLIVTHAYVRKVARERWEAIDAAFDSQAPDENDDWYEVGTVRRRLAATD
jgi:NAD(P)-dependent dehydrogenase (short-subunit alcohol dehydrogenase family)